MYTFGCKYIRRVLVDAVCSCNLEDLRKVLPVFEKASEGRCNFRVTVVVGGPCEECKERWSPREVEELVRKVFEDSEVGYVVERCSGKV